MMRRIVVCLALFSFVGFASAQEETETPDLTNGNIDEQFQYLLKESGNYNARGIRYEVVKINDLTKFNNNLKDTINSSKKTIVELRNTIAENTDEIAALKSQLGETTENLKQVTEDKDSVSFFGSSVSKKTYKGIVWGIIVVLIFLLSVFIYKFRNSNQLTQHAKSALSSLEEEFEQHRRRALEREQKISRKLQDEINKSRGK